VKLAQTMNPKSDNVVVINEAIIQKQAETVTNSPKKNLNENVKNKSEIIKLALQTLKPKLIDDNRQGNIIDDSKHESFSSGGIEQESTAHKPNEINHMHVNVTSHKII